MNQIARLTEEQNELGWRYPKVMFEMGNEPRYHGQCDTLACAEHQFPFHRIQRKGIYYYIAIRADCA